MKKTLTAIALFVAVTTGATTVQAAPHVGGNEGLQNYYYYFGSPCCDRIASNAPCGAPVASSACAPCCAPQTVRVPMEQVCTTCDPCGSRWNILNPFSYFG